jgi:hypothetical protein
MKKSFDCVEMKRKIQVKNRKMLEGLSPQELTQVVRDKIMQDPLLANIWKNSRRIRSQESLPNSKSESGSQGL